MKKKKIYFQQEPLKYEHKDALSFMEYDECLNCRCSSCENRIECCHCYTCEDGSNQSDREEC